MTDCVEEVNDDFRSIDKSTLDFSNKYTFGVKGLWLVGQSRDSFYVDAASDTEMQVQVYNSCGSCIIKWEDEDAKFVRAWVELS